MKNKLFIFTYLLIFSFISIGCIEDDSGYVSLVGSEQTGISIEREFVVHFIDVGQGDSTLIEIPNGNIMLIIRRLLTILWNYSLYFSILYILFTKI